MSILCEPDARAGELKSSIGGEVRTADSLAGAASMLDTDPTETLMVIGPEVPDEDALAFAADLRHSRPAVGVILTREAVNVEILTKALQAGVREVVTASDHGAVAAACRRSREVSRRMVAGVTESGPTALGKVITVFSAKGGCGKTTLAVNLGVVLAREVGRRVCIVDLDLAFGDVAISVQLEPARTIVDAVPMSGHLDATGTASILTPLKPGLDMLLAPTTPGDAEKVPPGLVTELFDSLRSGFDYIVVDTPPMLSEHVLSAMDVSSHLVLLTTPEVPALKNLRVTLDMLDLLMYPDEVRSVVLNRSDSKVGLKIEDVERVVRSPLAAHVPSSGAVPASINKGKPITLDNPGHPVSKAITRFVDERLIEAPVAAEPGIPPVAAWGKGREAEIMSLSDRLAQRSMPSDTPRETTKAPRRAARSADPFALVKTSVHESLLSALGPKLYDAHLPQHELEERVRDTLQAVLQRDETPMTMADRSRVAQEVADEILGHGPLEPYLRDPEVSEIMVNGHDQIYVERSGNLYGVEGVFSDESHLRRTIDKIVARVGRRVDESSPLVDARLPDGSRVNAVVPPVALDGSLLTIRKFSTDPWSVDDLIGFGTMTAQTAELLRACVRGKLNVVISGGTGSGKTTTLNVLSSFVPADERILTIEDAAELQLRQEHVLRLESRPQNLEGRGAIAIRDLVRNALRMRPDRIIVGEVRDGAALDMLQAMNTGHDGSITTCHANSPRDALSRLETMVLMASFDLPQRAIREQMASAIDLIIQQARLRDGTRRITHITEVDGMEGEIITLQDVFLFDFHAGVNDRGKYQGTLKTTGLRPHFSTTLSDRGIKLPPGLFGGSFEEISR